MFPEWRSRLSSTDENNTRYITADAAVERLITVFTGMNITEVDEPWCILPAYELLSLGTSDLQALLTHKEKVHVIVEGYGDDRFTSVELELDERLSNAKLDNLIDMLKTDEPKPEPIEHDMYRVNRVTYHDGHTQFKIMKGRAKGGEPVEDSFSMAKGTRLMDNLDEAIAKCNELMSEVVIDEGKAYTPILATKPKENEGTKDWSDY